MDLLIRIKKFFLDKKGFNWPLYLLMLCLGFLGFIYIENFTDVVLFWTFLAIVIYSIETYRLRDKTYRLVEESDKSRKYEFLPILSIKTYSKDYNFLRVGVSNIGKGLAQNIIVFMPSIVDPIKLHNLAPGEETMADFNMMPPNVLHFAEKGQKPKVEYMDIFGRKIVSEAELKTHPQYNALAIESWQLILPKG